MTKRLPFEIHAWSIWLEQHGPAGAGGHEWMRKRLKPTPATATTSAPSPTSSIWMTM
jgi:hypothetical protein